MTAAHPPISSKQLKQFNMNKYDYRCTSHVPSGQCPPKVVPRPNKNKDKEICIIKLKGNKPTHQRTEEKYCLTKQQFNNYQKGNWLYHLCDSSYFLKLFLFDSCNNLSMFLVINILVLQHPANLTANSTGWDRKTASQLASYPSIYI